MTILVTKANHDYWYKIKEFNTIEDIYNFIKQCKHSIIIEENSYTNDNVFKYWDGMKKEDIPIIKKCSLHIIIYNSWVE